MDVETRAASTPTDQPRKKPGWRHIAPGLLVCGGTMSLFYGVFDLSGPGHHHVWGVIALGLGGISLFMVRYLQH